MTSRAGAARGVSLVAFHVVRQSVRNRIVLVLAGFAALATGVSIVLAPLMQVDPDRLVFDLGLSALELAGVLVLLLSSALHHFEEREQQSLALTLVKPVARWQYACGLFLGQLLVLLALSLSLGLWTFAAVGAVSEWDSPLLPAVLPSACFLWVELSLLAALCLLFLQLATSMVAAVVYPLGAYVLGALSPTLRYVVEHSDSAWLVFSLRALRVLVPDFELFNLKNEERAAWPDLRAIAASLAYAAGYGGAALLVAVRLFSRREH